VACAATPYPPASTLVQGIAWPGAVGCAMAPMATRRRPARAIPTGVPMGRRLMDSSGLQRLCPRCMAGTCLCRKQMSCHNQECHAARVEGEGTARPHGGRGRVRDRRSRRVEASSTPRRGHPASLGPASKGRVDGSSKAGRSERYGVACGNERGACLHGSGHGIPERDGGPGDRVGGGAAGEDHRRGGHKGCCDAHRHRVSHPICAHCGDGRTARHAPAMLPSVFCGNSSCLVAEAMGFR
jgi:hypothetical protein